jgi:signal transduction histidine kinase
LARSPAGGVWAYGFGFVVRLAQVDGRWRIAEQLGGWNGVEGDIRGLWEEPDGTIWLASWRGVTRVPASARTGPRAPLSTRLVALRVDGASLPPEDARIAADHHAIEIEFAARALRDPNRVRYRTRLDGVGWTDSPEPVFRVARIPPGDHLLEAAASPDGRMWGEPYRLAFRVESAWYARGEVFALAAALFVALGLLAHRLRTAHLLGLERQRMRIATDLHDELGAGLGRLGNLGGIVAEGGVPAGAERQMGARSARTAGELGESLHDIVYSLRTGESRIEHLAEQLASRGRALFASNGTTFTTSFAHTGDGGIAPPVSRHVYRIAIEALHNAARHADARHVRLAIGPAPVDRIRLDIRDDGRGIGADTLREPDGMGLITMRQRAEAIGGTITIESGNGDGTRIVLVFDPRGPHGWRRRRPGGLS